MKSFSKFAGIPLLAGVVSLTFLIHKGLADEIEYPKTHIMAATANHVGSVHVTALEKFAEIIEQESNGNVTVTLFTGGSKGNEQENVKQLRTEDLHVAAVSTTNLTHFAPSATLTVLPYLFPEIENAYTLFGNNDFLTELGDRVAAESLTRPLGWMISGYRTLTNSQKPVTRLSDLEGLKIRVPETPIQFESFLAWEADPQPLAWSETIDALQQGNIDGQENPHSVNRDQKVWEVQKFITDLHYLLWVGPILVSEPWYQNLEPNLKSLIDRAAREAVSYEWEWAAEQNRLALQQCLDNGMQITSLNDEAEWKARARNLWPKFYKIVGGKEHIDRALEIMNTL